MRQLICSFKVVAGLALYAIIAAYNNVSVGANNCYP
jgi:hypothetical protein